MRSHSKPPQHRRRRRWLPLSGQPQQTLQEPKMHKFFRWPCLSLGLVVFYVGVSMYILSSPLNSSFESPMQRLPSSPGASTAVDSIVFVALGPASRSSSLLYALQSLREEGQYHGPVHVIVENEGDLDCLSSHLREPVETVVAVTAARTTHAVTPRAATTATSVRGADAIGREEVAGRQLGATGGGPKAIAQAKMAKMQLLELLPREMRRIVYIDCDVITQMPIQPFLDAVAGEWAKVDNAAAGKHHRHVTKAPPATKTTKATPRDGSARRAQDGATDKGGLDEHRSSSAQSRRILANGMPADANAVSTILIFPDAGGHTIPLCAGCDKAHSGVVALARGHSELCLKLWLDAFGGGGGDGAGMSTDQEALDYALRKGSGCEARWLDSHYLRFMKDIFVYSGLTRTTTFAHFTGLLHPEALNRLRRQHYEKSLGRSYEEWGAAGGSIASCAVGDV